MSNTISELDRVIDQANAELEMLVHINDDAQRDALVTGLEEDRLDARRTEADVVRLTNYVRKLELRRFKLVGKRTLAINKLAAK